VLSSGLKSKASIISVLLAFMITSVGVNAAKAQDFPSSEKSMFILDTSGSNDGKQLWAGLRLSILKKLPQALGSPKVRGIKNPKAPFDITVTAINADSENAPLFSIVEFLDAEQMWGLIYDEIGGTRPTPLRLEKILRDFFGATGVYDLLIQKYLSRDSKVRINERTCPAEVGEQWTANAGFMANYERVGRLKAAKNVCKIIIKISDQLIAADKFFSTPTCPRNSQCSDVIGALHRAAAAAAEAYDRDPKSRLCIAIASDMVSNNARINRNSSQNTYEVVMNSVSTADAITQGKKAATSADVKFPPKMIKVSVIGQGSGGIPPDKQQVLSAYWDGFWLASGVSLGKKVAALTEACRS
jgi:hypothetical protein